MKRIAVISGKGGSGKSSVTAALLSLWEKVIAVDCDVDASNLPLLFPHEILEREPFSSGSRWRVDQELCIRCGECVSCCAYGALQQEESGQVRVNDLLCEACGLCQRRCPAAAISIEEVAESSIYTSRFGKGMMVHGELHPGDDNSGKMVTRLREIADSLPVDKNAVQILDGPPGIGCPVLSTLTGMDQVVIVCEPTLSGSSDFRRALVTAQNYCQKIYVILNKCDINAENAAALENFCLEEGLPVIAHLPFDRKMVQAQVQGKTILEYAPDSVCAAELVKAWSCLEKSDGSH